MNKDGRALDTVRGRCEFCRLVTFGFMVVLVSSLAFATGCDRKPKWPDDYTWIAYLAGDDVTAKERVIEVFKENGIKLALPFGSRLVQIHVPKKDVTRATAILAEDAAERDYYIAFIGGAMRTEAEHHWNYEGLGSLHADLVKDVRFSESTPIGAVLRDLSVLRYTRRYPRVESIESLEKNYERADRWGANTLQLFKITLEGTEGTKTEWVTLYYQFSAGRGPIRLSKSFMQGAAALR